LAIKNSIKKEIFSLNSKAIITITCASANTKPFLQDYNFNFDYILIIFNGEPAIDITCFSQKISWYPLPIIV